MTVDTQNAVALNGLTGMYVIKLYIKIVQKFIQNTTLQGYSWMSSAISHSLCFFTKTKLGFIFSYFCCERFNKEQSVS